MAKRRKARKRRRMGAALSTSGKKGQMMKLLVVGAGVLAGDFLNEALDKVIPKTKDANGVETVNTNLAAIGQGGLGALLLMKSKNPIMSLGGGFMAGAGLRRVLKKAGVIKGYQSVPVIGRRVAGYLNTPVLGAVPAQLAGSTPAQLQGYKVNGYVPSGSGMGVLAGFDSATGSGVTNTNGGGYMG